MAPKKKNSRGRSGSNKAAPQQPATSARQVESPPPTDAPTSPALSSSYHGSSTTSVFISQICELLASSRPSLSVSQPSRGGSGSRPYAGRPSPAHQEPIPRRTSGGRNIWKEYLSQVLQWMKDVISQLSEVADGMEELETRTEDRAARLVVTPLVEHTRWVEKSFKITEKNLQRSLDEPPPPGFFGLFFPPDWIPPPEKPSSILPEPCPLSQLSALAPDALPPRPSSPPSNSSEAPSSSGRSNSSRAEPRSFPARREPMEEYAACQLLAAINFAICELSVVQVCTQEAARKMINITLEGWVAGLAMNVRNAMGICMKAEQLVLCGFGGDTSEEGTLKAD